MNLVRNIGRRLLPPNGTSSINDGLQFEECEYLPVGWKRAAVSFIGEDGDNIQGYNLYKSREGNIYATEGKVLRKLKSNGDDVQKLRSKLILDGWDTSNSLPDNHLFRRHEYGTAFMDADGNVYLDSEKFLSTLGELQVSKAREEFNLLEVASPCFPDNEFISKEDVKKKVPAVSQRTNIDQNLEDTLWKSDDPSVPLGWMIKYDPECRSTQIKSPSNQTFSSRAGALKFMVNSPDEFSRDQVAEMRGMLTHEFWEDHSLLPPDWRMMRLEGGAILVITEVGKVITTLRGARDNVKARGIEELLINWDKFIGIYRPVNRENKGTGAPVLSLKSDNCEVIWKSHVDLPSEWRHCVSGNGEQIRDDKGNIYSSRKDAIDAMIRNNSSPSDIFKLWNTLHVEGWLEDVNLPISWKRKYI